MNILRVLAAFYSEATVNRLLLVVVFWIIWPGLMFVIGLIFESREVPLIKHQSRAFFPGDLAFGVILVAIVSMYAKTGVDIPMVGSPYWWAPIATSIFVIGWRWRREDVANYPKRAVHSPTKIVHDIMGYFMIPTLLLGLAIPQICMFDEGIFADTRMGWFVAAMAIVFYLFCVAMDFTRTVDTVDMNARHPEDWKPIWKRK